MYMPGSIYTYIPKLFIYIYILQLLTMDGHHTELYYDLINLKAVFTWLLCIPCSLVVFSPVHDCRQKGPNY